jgi:hypothetical protein
MASAILVVVASTTGFLLAATTGHNASGATVVVSSRPIDPSACSVSEPAGGRPSVLTAKIVHIDAGAVVLVNTCIDGTGPFPFIDFPAFGCPVNLAEVKSGGWTLGSASLPPQLVARLPASGLQAAGLLGSDVLSRFGAVVIDYRAGRILLESGRP